MSEYEECAWGAMKRTVALLSVFNGFENVVESPRGVAMQRLGRMGGGGSVPPSLGLFSARDEVLDHECDGRAEDPDPEERTDAFGEILQYPNDQERSEDPGREAMKQSSCRGACASEEAGERIPADTRKEDEEHTLLK